MLHLTPLDRVEVVSGDLKGIIGIFTHMKGGTYQVRMSNGKTYGFTEDQVLIKPNTKTLLMPCALFSDYHDIETGMSYNEVECVLKCSGCMKMIECKYESVEGQALCADCIEIVTMKDLADCWRENHED